MQNNPHDILFESWIGDVTHLIDFSLIFLR